MEQTTINHGPAFEAICTELRRSNPRWSDKKIMAEAKVIYSKRRTQ